MHRVGGEIHQRGALQDAPVGIMFFRLGRVNEKSRAQGHRGADRGCLRGLLLVGRRRCGKSSDSPNLPTTRPIAKRTSGTSLTV